jgi:hypothetical protein
MYFRGFVWLRQISRSETDHRVNYEVYLAQPGHPAFFKLQLA